MDASYCLCGRPYDPNIFMIQCDACKDWFHSSCCSFQEHLAIEIDRYHCPRCVPLYGPSIYKPYINWHRHDFWDEDATNKPVQTGTAIFIRELRARHFASEGEVVVHMRGQQMTEAVLQSQGFNSPIVVDGKDGLDMTMPPDNFSLYDVEAYVGSEKEIDVIDVTRQSNIKMKLRDYVEYYNTLNRNRVFNVVSLEFSNSGLATLVEAPLIARKLDWANWVWPRDYAGRPQVGKYCLMSVKGSYTDFHIDFGGTSVWYHILRGEKIFYFVSPTMANLTLYQQWMTSTNQSETFFGDQVDKCYKCILRQGQTMLIPTGWIHAVYTPVDSLVFGGNFLHSLNMPMQLSVYDIEKKIKTEQKFLYPNFEMMNWFAGSKLLEQLVELNTEERKCPTYLLLGLKQLLINLKHWNTEKDVSSKANYNPAVREQIPFTINVAKLLKDIAKEIRHAERYINHLNPPKPERESKRKRKKPINKDFVDYSMSPKASTHDYIPIPDAMVKYPKPGIKVTLPKPAVIPYENTNTLLNDGPDGDQLGWGVPNFERPEETIAIHRGGTVLKFKIGTKDLIPSAAVAQTDPAAIPEDRIYDFHDESDRDEDCFKFTIDENPAPPPSKKIKKPAGIKMRLPVKSKKPKDNPDEPKNGIESLLKASALSAAPDRTSPSTQEAIAGMLSISQTTYVQPGKSQRSRKYGNLSPPFEEENIKNVHQDDDYVYPSLDNSDDEDVHIFKPRGRSKVDEPWNPKARVGPLLPKMNRPAREGTKKQAVEKVLEAAAAKRANESPEKSPKRQYRRKKLKPKSDIKSPSTATSNASTSGAATPVSPPKPRKGMKTVKQRLGKILKIHKMIH
ncbi:unnamed protein product [Brassicogethes aeneus]|uniref:Uncharacterized protein n=1 Tax=Brassicogethes aeneus TaxID=1431903 RepID=A0A9P0FLF9_BRAAE|nr:unnamed protein product [Brassicogethes aeneus]